MHSSFSTVNSELKNRFELLYQTHYRMVMQLCMGFLKGDQDQSKDLTQEVFIQVWNNLDRFREESSSKTWIYRITVNTCLNFLKKQKNKDQKLGEILRDQETTEEINFTETDPSKMLFEAMSHLSEIDRLVTGLLLEDVPQEEIATILGISDGNLRVKIHRIKLRLKKLISYE